MGPHRFILTGLLVTLAVGSGGLLGAYSTSSAEMAFALIEAGLGCLAAALLFTRRHARSNPEFEQALIRMGVLALVLISYVVTRLVFGTTPELAAVLWTGGPMFAVGWAILAHILFDPEVRTLRRSLGNTADIITVSVYVALGGQYTAYWLWIVLWVIFGAGFRYGAVYLTQTSFVAIVGLAGAVYWNPYFWQGGPTWPLTTAIALGVISLPPYVALLLNRLHAARKSAEAANLEKARFLARVSHDLRTPLATIDMGSRLLAGHVTSEDDRETARSVSAAAASLGGLIGDLLDLNAMEAGRPSYRATVTDPLAPILAAYEAAVAPAREKGLALRLIVESALPAAVTVDARRLTQALGNLITNAIKYSDAGTVEIRVRSESAIFIDVADSGPGIAPDILPRVFEPFFQGHQAAAGAGLGLAIVKQLVGLMGGEVRLTSTSDSGTCFTLELPRREMAADPSPPMQFLVHERCGDDIAKAHVRHAMGLMNMSAVGTEAAQIIVTDRPLAAHGGAIVVCMSRAVLPSEGIAILAGETLDRVVNGLALGARLARRMQAPAVALTQRVLVVDDTRVNRRLVARQLESLGATTVQVATADEAEAALDRSRFDVVLTDLRMEGMDGIELARRVRLISSSTGEGIGIVLLTGDATPDARARAAHAGVDEFLARPPALEDLAKAIDSAARKHSRETNVTPIASHPGFTRPRDSLDEGHWMSTIGEGLFEPKEVLTLASEFEFDCLALVERLSDALAAGDGIAWNNAIHGLRSAALHIRAKRLVALLQPDSPNLALARADDRLVERIRTEVNAVSVRLRGIAVAASI